MIIKAITLWQPWASLVAIGAKKIETRSWSTKYRGPLAIHAAKRYTKEQEFTSSSEPFHTVLRQHGVYEELNLGNIVGICNLINCVEIIDNRPDLKRAVLKTLPVKHVVGDHDGCEWFFGDYTPGRFAWILEDVMILEKPIPAKGMQGFWNVFLDLDLELDLSKYGL